MNNSRGSVVTTHHPESISDCRRMLFSILSLTVMIFLIYSNSFHNSWHFDDEPNITGNPNIQVADLNWKTIEKSLFSDQRFRNIPYRPVACLSFALNYYFGGDDVVGYHLVNITIHIITAFFLFLVILQTLRLVQKAEENSDTQYFIALLSTLLWAIHPIQVQAVTYIVQRMASMAGMFFILSMYFYIKARISRGPWRRAACFLLSLISFLLALSSKENTVLLPLTLFAYENMILQEPKKEVLLKRIRILLFILIFILAIGFTYLYLQGHNIFYFLDGYQNRPFTLSQRLLTQTRVLLFYLSLILYPIPSRFNIAHSMEYSTSLLHPVSTLLAVLTLAAILCLVLWGAKKYRLFSFCLLFFFLNHLVESTILPLEMVFEHRNYIPSMFLFVPVAAGFHALLRRYRPQKIMFFVVSSFIVLLLVGIGNATYVRNFSWRNEESLWIDALEKSPDIPRVYINLGRYYQDHGMAEKAQYYYEQAIALKPKIQTYEHYIAYYNLGIIYEQKGQRRKAISCCFRSLALKPDFAAPYNNLATIMEKEGRYDLLYRYLQVAYSLDRGNIETNYNLGLYYIKSKQPDRAIFHLNKLIKVDKVKSSASFLLGLAYREKGRIERAIYCLKRALSWNPRNLTPSLFLIELYHRQGAFELARREADKIVNLMAGSEKFRDQVLENLEKASGFHLPKPYPDVVGALLLESIQRHALSLNHLKNRILHTTILKVKNGGFPLEESPSKPKKVQPNGFH